MSLSVDLRSQIFCNDSKSWVVVLDKSVLTRLTIRKLACQKKLFKVQYLWQIYEKYPKNVMIILIRSKFDLWRKTWLLAQNVELSNTDRIIPSSPPNQESLSFNCLTKMRLRHTTQPHNHTKTNIIFCNTRACGPWKKEKKKIFLAAGKELSRYAVDIKQ